MRIPSPGDPSAYFAPISPAAKTTNEPQNSNPILNMLMVNSRGITSTFIMKYCRFSKAESKNQFKTSSS